jgi:hypothetical protein
MSVSVTFACGHSATVLTDGAAPQCLCGETRVSRVKAPAPRFRGVATGPHATVQALDAMPINAAPDGPLQLNERTHG